MGHNLDYSAISVNRKESKENNKNKLVFFFYRVSFSSDMIFIETYHKVCLCTIVAVPISSLNFYYHLSSSLLEFVCVYNWKDAPYILIRMSLTMLGKNIHQEWWSLIYLELDLATCDPQLNRGCKTMVTQSDSAAEILLQHCWTMVNATRQQV